MEEAEESLQLAALVKELFIRSIGLNIFKLKLTNALLVKLFNFQLALSLVLQILDLLAQFILVCLVRSGEF